MQANPWVYDEYGIRCELVILHTDLWNIEDWTVGLDGCRNWLVGSESADWLVWLFPGFHGIFTGLHGLRTVLGPSVGP